MYDHKYLLQLIKEDQEPFNLNNYIADRRSQLNRPPFLHKKSVTIPRIKNHIPHSKTFSKSKSSFCDHVPFRSKSSLSDFLSPSTTRTGSVFLNIPAPTSALLLEAAMRIKKHSKPRNHMNYIGVGLFSSVLKKLKDRKTARKKREINEGRTSLGMDASTSSFRSEHCRKFEFLAQEGESRGSSLSRKSFGWSPFSPFRFSPHRSPSSGRHSPASSSSTASSSSRRRQEQKKESLEVKNFRTRNNNKKEEKEESSPVSVLLDRMTFDNEDDEDKTSFESLQIHRAKEEELLKKLRRFDKLVNLDPVELEKTMVQQFNFQDETESIDDDYELDVKSEENDYILAVGVFSKKMEYYCLVEDDEIEESNTNIDQMILMINDQLINQCNTYQEEERQNIGMQIELAIFGLLVEELVEDFIQP